MTHLICIFSCFFVYFVGKEKLIFMENNNKITKNNFTKYLLIILGSLFVILGIIGIFLPLLPTTPFLVLASICYIKSSSKFYNWLMNNKYLGNYIKNYIEGNGITVKAKVLYILPLWITITYSAIFVVDILYMRIILFLIAICITIHILHIKTLKP